MCNVDDALEAVIIGPNYRKDAAIGRQPNAAYNLQGFVKI